MIISHRYRFIFLRTRKTAGTSVEIALSRHVGSDDVVAALCERDERLRLDSGGVGPQNHLDPGHQCTQALRNALPGPQCGVRYYNHMPASEVRKLVGLPVWNSYFKFCLERNPWEKVISLYYHRHRREPRPHLRDFIESEAADAFNWPLYHIGSESAVDWIVRYERLDEMLEQVRVRLGLPSLQPLPRAKAQFRVSHPVRYDRHGAAAVAKIFGAEIDKFGYHCPDQLLQSNHVPD